MEQDTSNPAGSGREPEREPSAHSVLDAISRTSGEAPRVFLREDEQGDGDSPVIDPSAAARAHLPAGKGNYQILGEIAKGGMGVVFKGHDTDLGRDVALKVLHEELAKKPVLLQRFVEEAQIGGQLQHPGIVPVYELGLMADNRPYFTMKLVKGRTLGSMLKKRRTPADDRRRFLGIFEHVCQTMAYAHSRGVIHRDLKPENIMVGAFGEVQVVDWGLAKVLDRASKTDDARTQLSQISIIETVRSKPDSDGTDSLVGSVMGTPAYMPPEQATGNVDKLDERSDVFSLGAILCEILTGQPPYPKTETLKLAAGAKIDGARERLDSCGADSELVQLSKDCLMPARSARPADASFVAEFVHEHLASVEERAREARVKAHEERKARRLTLALAATVLMAVVGGGGGWIWIERERVRRIDRTEGEVVAALGEASLLQGQERWGEARAAAGQALAILEAGDAGQELRSRAQAQFEEIDRAATGAAATENLARGNDELLLILEAIRQEEGDELDSPDWAVIDQHYRQVFASEGLLFDGPDDGSVFESLKARGIDSELAVALDSWSNVKRRAGDMPASDRLTALARRLDDDPMRVRLREAVAAGRGSELIEIARTADFSQVPASTLSLLADSLSRTDASDVSLAVYRQAQFTHPDDFLLTFNLARALDFTRPEQNEEAFRFYTAALSLRPESIETLHRLGLLLNGEFARPVEAAQIFQRALDIAGDNSHIYRHLGQSLQNAGEETAALSAFMKAVDMNPNESGSFKDMGDMWFEMAEWERALEAYEKALAIRPAYASAVRGLGETHYYRGDLEASIEAYRRALVMEPTHSLANGRLIESLCWAGRYDEVYEQFDRSLEHLPRDPNLHATMAIFLAFCPDDFFRDTERAVAEASLAVEIAPGDTYSISWLAGAHLMNGDPATALDLYDIVMSDGPGDASDHFLLAMIHHDLGNVEQSRRWFWRGMQYMEAPSYATQPMFVALRDQAAARLGIEDLGLEEGR